MLNILLTFALGAGSAAHALNLTFEKALTAEFTRCEPVLPIRDMHAFAMKIQSGFMSEDQIKSKFGDAELQEFKRLTKVVVPYLNALDERGEIMDLDGKDALTLSCAKFAKGVLITPYQFLVLQMVQHALREQLKVKQK